MFLTEPLRDLFLPLDALGAVPPDALDRLAALGVSTLDEPRDLWSFGDRGALVDYLGESPARWFAHGAPALYGLRGATREGAPTPKDPLGPQGLVPRHYPRGAVARQPALPSANDVAALRARLDAGRPVVVTVETFPAWDYPSVNLSGEVPMPLPGATRDGAHAVCLVGYMEHAGLPGGGRFVFRNSWGGLWASEGRAEGGYGTLYFDYLRHRGLDGFA
jgi:hypothetical protein